MESEKSPDIPGLPAEDQKLIRRYERAVWYSKFKRLLAAVPIADLLATFVALAAIVTIGASIVGGNVNAGTMRYLWICGVVASVLLPVLIALLASKTWLEYQRRKFDPTLVWTFQKEFDGLADKRKEAAEVCFDFLRSDGRECNETNQWAAIGVGERLKVEPVLDCFEDVGFYLSGDQFSDEVTHHNFFHWIRGWYSVLRPYIEYYQTIKGERGAYIHVESLYRRTSVIERQYMKPKLLLTTDEDKLDFLREEGGEGDLNVHGALSIVHDQYVGVLLTITAVNVGKCPVTTSRVAVLLSKSSAPLPQGISEERAAEMRAHLTASEISPAANQVVELSSHGGQHQWEMALQHRLEFQAHTINGQTMGRGYVMLTSGRKLYFDFILLQDSVWESVISGKA